jgi:hypothetical protein
MAADTKKILPLTPPIKTAVKITQDRLANLGWGPLPDKASVASGLQLDKVVWQSLIPVRPYLNDLNYNPILTGTREQVYHWDCVDRALWAIAHTRHRFPGLPMAIAEGKGTIGDLKDQDHAIVILWSKKDQNSPAEYVYYDPVRKIYDIDKKNDFGTIRRIIAMPITNRPAPNTIPPLNLIPDDIIGHSITMDEYYDIYPLNTPDKKGVLDYLENEMQDKCIDQKHHDGAGAFEMKKFGAADRALWNKVHIRRSYPGCPVSVALGNAKDGKSKAVNMIWTGPKDRVIWDPKVAEDPITKKPIGGVVKDFEVLASFM